MSSMLQSDGCYQMAASQWWRRLVNAYEVMASMVYLQCNNCVIHSWALQRRDSHNGALYKSSLILERPVPEITYYMSSGTLNSTHSLTSRDRMLSHTTHRSSCSFIHSFIHSIRRSSTSNVIHNTHKTVKLNYTQQELSYRKQIARQLHKH